MAYFITWIDSVMLNLTEQACRRFQLLTGRTNVWLAVQLTNLSIVVYFVWMAVYFWGNGVALRIFITLFCGGVLYALTQTIFKVPIEAYEEAVYRRLTQGLRNPRRVRDALLRISFLTLSVVLCYPIVFVYINLRIHILLLSYSLIVLTTVVLYLLACDPLPPCAGRLREWLRQPVVARVAAKNVQTITWGTANLPFEHITNRFGEISYERREPLQELSNLRNVIRGHPHDESHPDQPDHRVPERVPPGLALRAHLP